MLRKFSSYSFNIGLSFLVVMYLQVLQDDRVVGCLDQFLYDILAYKFGGTLISQFDCAEINIKRLLVFEALFILLNRHILFFRLYCCLHLFIDQLLDILHILPCLLCTEIINLMQLSSFSFIVPLFTKDPFIIYLILVWFLRFSQILMLSMQELRQMGSTLGLENLILVGLKEGFFGIHLFCDVVWSFLKSTPQTLVSLCIAKAILIFGKWPIMYFIHRSRSILLPISHIMHDFAFF